MSLIECLLIVCVVGLLAAVALPGLTALSARWEVRSAVRAARALFVQARLHAQTTGRRTAVLILPPHRLLVVSDRDTIAAFSSASRAVQFLGTRDSMAYAASGVAWGASNLRLLVQRAGAVDTLFVSRLGRVR
jgi:type II secretory pathway pseudopilin PulG